MPLRRDVNVLHTLRPIISVSLFKEVTA
jgi:hypothetical protein